MTITQAFALILAIDGFRYLFYAYLFVSSFYVLFSAYATWHRMQKEGTLSSFDWFFLGPWAVFGYLEVLAFDCTFGSLMYLEAPWAGAESWKPWTWTFTGHCKKWKASLTWRGVVARWWQVKLNHIEAGHV